MLNFHPALVLAPRKANDLEPIDILLELIELQRLDSGLDSLEKIKKNFQSDIAAIDANIQSLKETLQTEKNGHEELMKWRKSQEIEMGTLDSHIVKYTRQQNDVKSSDQVTALGQEIEKSKLAKAAIEENILETLMKEDEQKAQIKKTTEILAEEEKRAAAEKTEIQQKITDCNKAIADKHVERTAQLAKVEEPYNRGYENLRNKGKKLAVVAVTEENNCGGCNMNVPPQVLHEIRQKMAIKTCQCTRYLYIKE
jgi:predicted  nucleic acid-binding Zn-ribbon protein